MSLIPWWRWGMLVVLLVAAWLRLGRLPELPVGLHYDEAANLILTRQITEGGYRPLFIRAYTGKEVLFFYAAAPWVRMTGDAAWGLRLGAAMLGILTVAATHAATLTLSGRREGARGIALLAAGWMAVAFPHLLLSRYGFRAISQPLMQALTVATLWRGLRSGRIGWLGVAGACLGLTAYTYLAARLFPVPLALATGWLWIRSEPHARRRLLGRLAIVLAVAVVVVAPLVGFFLRYPETFTTRISQVIAPTSAEALRGVADCLRALFWPGRGDGYVRFNDPGLPMMDPVSAVLGLLGLILIVGARRARPLEGAARTMIVTAIFVMTLPSALATGEITPSNLRMVGIFPFLAVLPAWGTWILLSSLGKVLKRTMHASEEHGLAVWVPRTLILVLFGVGAVRSGIIYTAWAGSEALFLETDGAMALAAHVVDALAAPEGPTIYIASEHYRHPTVAALATHYREAKWLTGGASLVLPMEGDAVYLIPTSLQPPATWPAFITEVWTPTAHLSPAGVPALTAYHLRASHIAGARASAAEGGTDPADFAHVVQVYDAAPMIACRVAEPCPILVVWEPLSSYTTLQPVVRLWHPQSGEWTRAMAFHYPPEEWALGDLVLDQLVLDPPIGLPPVAGYRIGVGFYDPSWDEALPRLVDERFAGFEAIYPAPSGELRFDPISGPPTEAHAREACAGLTRPIPEQRATLNLLGWRVERLTGTMTLPGSELFVRLCWQAGGDAPPFSSVRLYLDTGTEDVELYAGRPAQGYGFHSWREGEFVDDRYRLRLPRSLPSGDYELSVQVDEAEPIRLSTLTVEPVMRTFAPPEMDQSVALDFSDASGAPVVRLQGYDLSALEPGQLWHVVLAWQALNEMPDDYIVFLHLREADSGLLVAQVDEMPRAGDYPTSLWMRGEVVVDEVTLTLPSDLAPGRYTLSVGLYLSSGVHLHADGATNVPLADVPFRP